jgi:oxazoline/thiazoline dehydrogenase
MKLQTPEVATLDERRCYRLSRHVQIRPEGDSFVAESLITGYCERLPNAAAIRLFLSLMTPADLGALLAPLDPRRSSALLTFFSRCLDGGLITAIAEDGTAEEDAMLSLAHWEPHDLAFHLRSRHGRNARPVGANWHLADRIPPEPARRAGHGDVLETIPLEKPDLDRLKAEDWTLTRALEERRSRYSVEPLPLTALAHLLFRACRVTSTRKDQMNGGLLRKVHPSGGSLHSLEVYVVAHRCTGLARGGYRYDPFAHALLRLRDADDDVMTLLRNAQSATLALKDLPSVLLIVSSRFRRVTRKYQSLAYHVILQEVGTLYQTIYLVGQTLGLAVSALGSGDSERFARVFATDFFAESSVGEMIVGGGGGADK